MADLSGDKPTLNEAVADEAWINAAAKKAVESVEAVVFDKEERGKIIDRLMLRGLFWLEARTLRRLKRRWPSEWRWQLGVNRNNGDPERAFLREAKEKL